MYDYTSNTWSQGGLAPVEFNHFQAVTYEGLIWVIGAFKTNIPNPEQNADYIYMYNPATEQWIQGMEIPESRKRGASGLAMHNNKFYLVCGSNNGHSSGYVSYFDEFDPETGTWTQLDDAPRVRDHFQAVVYNDKLYAIGGRLTGGPGGLFEPQVPEVDVYDFNTQLWSTLNPSENLPFPRAGLGVVVFNDEIYTIGGESTFNRVGNGQVDVVESYNPATNTWTTRNSLNYRRHGIQAIVSGQAIYVTCGSEGGSPMHNMEYYGIDNPVGSPNINSVFAPDETTKSFTYLETDGTKSIDIILSNSAGTTGTYIDNITINGANYTLAEDYSNRFLGANSNVTIRAVLNDTTEEESNGTVTVTYNNNMTLDINLEGELDSTLSTDFNVSGKTSLIAYPSPTSGTFSINKATTQLDVYDISGKLVKSFSGSFNEKTSYDISNLSANLYFIIVKNKNKATYTTKLIKK